MKEYLRYKQGLLRISNLLVREDRQTDIGEESDNKEVGIVVK